MNQENCRLIFTGKFVDDMSLERVHQNLADIFKADIEKIKKMFSEQRRLVIKKNANRQTCLKMQKRLLDAGAICDIISNEAEDGGRECHSTENPAAAPRQPEPGLNPYAPPRADLQPAMVQGSQHFIAPEKRPASHGASWFFQAVSLFLKSPFLWILTMICFFLVGLIQIIPILGPIAMSLLGPVFFAGLILGAKALDETGRLKVGCLFQGFRQGFGQLVLLGLLFLVAMIIGAVLSMGIAFAAMGFDLSGLQGQMIQGGFPTMVILLMILLVAAIFIPVMMGYWFAPALIAINEKPVFEAISLSFKGCLKNILPFLVYSLVAMGVMIGLMVLAGLVIGLVGATGAGTMGMLAVIMPFIIMLPVMLAIMPIYVSSIYTSYKDIFYHN